MALGYRNRAEWQSLLRPVVALNAYRYGVDLPVVRQGSVVVSMRVTLPLETQDKILQQMRTVGQGSPTLSYGDFVFGFERSSTTETAFSE